MSFFGRIAQDVTHPFGLGNAPRPQQPVRTPAPVNRPNPIQVSRTPAPQALSVRQARPAALSIAPVTPTAPLSVRVAAPQQLQVGNKTIAPNPQARTGVAAPVKPPSAIQQAGSGFGQVVKRLPFPAAPAINLGQAGKAIEKIVPHIPQAPKTNAIGRGVNSFVVDPLKKTDTNISQVFQGKNPYKGSIKQQFGQASQDAINMAGVLPIGKAAQLAGKSAPLLTKVATGAKGGVKIGAGFGAAQGGSTSLQNNLNLKDSAKTIAANTLIGGTLGATLGVAAPLAGAGGRQVIKGAKLANDAKIPLNEGGFVGGGNAKGFKQAQQQGRVFDGVDGKAMSIDKPTPAPSTKLVPPQPTAALPATEQAGKVGGESLVNDTSKLPVYGTKQVSGVDKAFRSTRSVIERQGENGKALGGLLQKSRDDAEIYQGQLQKALPTVRSLKGKEFENFVEATQGKVNPLNPKVAKAVEEWQAVHPGIRDRAVGAGLDVGDLGPNYYPHFIDYAKIFKDKNLYNQSINSLVETGQASTPEEAIGLLNHAKDVSRNRTFGNLEASREIDLPFYDKTPNSLVSYIGSSAKRISQTENLGAKDEHALKLIAQAGQQGFDTQAMKEAYNVASGAKRYGETATKVSNGLRQYQSTTRLGLGALTNVGQNVNTGIVTGHIRTLTSAMKQFSPKTRSFVQDTGVISDAVLNDLKQQSGFIGKTLGHITAPGFGKVESINRSIAATAGRDYGLRLAQKGKIKELQRLGVTGNIENKTLTEAQQIQVARKVVEKTQFKVDAQDLPGWADSPGGKLVSQFRTFSYKQGGFISNEVLKPMRKGNFMPLGRLLAALPVGYALYETKRTINGRPEETSPTKRGLATFQNIGGAGLAFDIYQGLNPPNSKYTPTDRRVSMALGTLGGPTLGLAGQVAGAASDLIQRKNTPTDPSKLVGKVPIGKNDQSYTDATQAARLALNQIPVIGGPIKNRVLPYKKQADAEAGYADSKKPTHGSPFEALGQILGKVTGQKAAGADSLSPDQAIAKVKADKKTAEVNYKATLSKNDYDLTKLNKQERQKLIDQKVVTADKFKGLDKYAADQKLRLGLATAKKSKVNDKIDQHSQKVLNEYNNLDDATRKAKSYKEYDYDYKVAKAKFDNKLANGDYSTAQKIKAQDALKKVAAGQGFTKDTREAYGLTNNELFDYVHNDKNGNAIVKDVLAYGDKLAADGLEKKNKFRDKYGNVTLASKESKAAGAGRRAGAKSIRRNLSSAKHAKNYYTGKSKTASVGNEKFKLPGQKTASAKGANVKLISYKTPKQYTTKKPKNGVFA